MENIAPEVHLRLLVNANNVQAIKAALISLAESLPDDQSLGAKGAEGVTVRGKDHIYDYDLLTSDRLADHGIDPEEFLYLGWHADTAHDTPQALLGTA